MEETPRINLPKQLVDDLENQATSTVPSATTPWLGLHQHDIRVLQSRGIDPDVARERGAWTATLKPQLAKLGFSPAQQRVPALVIPCLTPAGQIGTAYIRPHTPRIDDRGRAIKYEMPAKHKAHIDVPHRALLHLLDVTEPLWITEGPLKADAAVSHAMTCIALPGVWSWGRTPELIADWDHLVVRDRQVNIAFDSDAHSNAHVRAAQNDLAAFLENRGARVFVAHIPVGPGGEKQGLDDYLASGGSVETLLATLSPAGAAPAPTLVSAPTVPTMSPDMVPAPLRKWLVDAAARRCVPLECLAAPAIVAAGAAVGRAVGIKPDRYSHFVVPPNLWGAVVAPPGQMKTQNIKEALAPYERLEREALREYEEARVESAGHVKALEARIRGTEHAIETAAKGAKPEDVDRLEAELAALIQERDEAAPSPVRRIIVDATTEKAAILLKESLGSLLLRRDELDGWIQGMNKQGREGDRQFWLEAWNGTGSFTYDRMGRGTLYVPNMTLSVIGGIQDSVIRRHVDKAAGGQGDDGFIQRFQLLVWPDGLPPFRPPNRWPDAEAQKRAEDVYRRLATLETGSLGVTLDPGDIPAIRFGEDAQKRYDEWRSALEARLRSGETSHLPAFEAHLGKYRGLVPRLALLFHLIEGGRGSVSLEAVELAIAWGEFLEQHAVKLYACAGQDEPRGTTSTPTETDAAIVTAVASLDAAVTHGKLSVADITVRVNEQRGLTLTPKHVAGRLRALGFDTNATTATSGKAIVYDPAVLKRHLPLVQLAPSEGSERSERVHAAPQPEEQAERSDPSDHTVEPLQTSSQVQGARTDAVIVGRRACLIPTHHTFWKNAAGELICQSCHPQARPAL